jgi:hypothetical protein
MHILREAVKKEAKSFLVFAATYALGVVLYFQFSPVKKEGFMSWLVFGTSVAFIAYLLPAIWRLKALTKLDKK